MIVEKEKVSPMIPESDRRRAAVRRAARRAAARGLTLVELVIVITIIGVVTAAIAVGVIQQQKRANIKAAGLACNTIRESTTLYMANVAGAECPTVDDLKGGKYLDTTFNTKDPWGGPYKISCDADDITVSSAGPDKKVGTEDDIQVPAAQAK
jgi:general secretion pathway protein G